MSLPITGLASVLMTFSMAVMAQAWDLAPVKTWFAAQDRIASLSADFIQTRTFRTLQDPLTRSGHLWFQSPDTFRWELGVPPALIVIHTKKQTTLIEPRKRRAQIMDPYVKNPSDNPSSIEAMNFLFSKDFNAFEKEFDILDLQLQEGRYSLTIRPRNLEARQAVRNIHLVFDPSNNVLHSFEITFRDGSSIRNAFTKVEINGKLPSDIFTYDLSDFTLTDAQP